jgi:hypothetical protein
MRLSALLLLAALIVASSVRAASKDPPKEDPLVWKEHVVPGPAVTLRMKRDTGKSLIYEGSLERSQEGPAKYWESGTFYLNVLCARHSEADNMDEVATLRTFTDRKRTETLANGQTKKLILENTNELINLGPNFSVVGSLQCYKYDAQNRLAYKNQEMVTLKDGRIYYGSTIQETQDKISFLTSTDKLEIQRANIQSSGVLPMPHICINETPHYLFPIFSGHAVAPGDTWKFKVPVIIPVEPMGSGQLLPSQFNATMVGRLREVQTTPAGKVAIVDYQVSGIFDTQGEEFSTRFAQSFLNDNRVIHKLNGEGTLSLDVDKGRILSKNETFLFTMFAQVTATDNGKVKTNETKVEVTSRYDVKLLPPGTRLQSGAVVPEYDDK